jgi:hypothetical protein
MIPICALSLALGIFMEVVTPIQIRFQNDELAAIDAYRRNQSNPPTRPQAARELIRYALNQRASCGDDVNAGGVAAQP